MKTADEILEEGLRDGSLQVGEGGEVYVMRDGAVLAIVHKDVLPDLMAVPS